ncbi:glycosyltransferase involved in cell wall biosynthesis [Oceanihabitans sediminis]|uniref:Glycosyltransferase WbuB n=1 Tax=Oceanihabitans sediminis TaxID=1812012 RepID=A0A368PAR7_9FLAO|nr:glycosyltransferase family 4 protein [Oceanihabitans sediminis]RBP34658.1 glycosyltransferase involved in cell wall biosynthesis [Oceanihabitans sediminis]RCU58311.1 glycosyltransferase WbuB [Oceanihabitans sediminis]
MKDVLIITSYFPPEIGAASNRIFHLAEGLEKRNFNVQVITPLPNYPTGKIFENYKGEFRHSSTENNIQIHRLWLYATVSKNKFLRLIAMLSYSFSLIWFFTFNKIPKTVIVQSPPLLVAFTSMFFLRSKKRKLILNVSDLWPIAGLELGALKKNFSYKMLENIERFNYKSADIILGQSEEILTHIRTLSPEKKSLLYRNYPDFIAPKIVERSPNETKIKLVYAGLLGIAQGIHKLCTELKYNHIELHIYGSGAEQNLIEDFIKKHPKLPIYFHGSVSRSSLHKALLQYDIAIIPLLNRIYGSVPSKIFEYAKLGLPILYFGGGEGENIVNENKLGWVAEAGNYQDLNKLIARINTSELTLEYKQKIKEKAINVFNLEKQLEEVSRLI